MPQARPKIRLYVEAPFAEGQAIGLSVAQSHYLVNVMRQPVGAEVLVFNGADGEWLAEIVTAHKKATVLVARSQVRAQTQVADVELMFAPIRKERTQFIAEKATELGVRALRPVITEFTNADRVRTDKMTAHAIEAAEQCGGLSVPTVHESTRFAEALAALPAERWLMFCDEEMSGGVGVAALAGHVSRAWTVLIGPEGGFSPAEREMLLARANTVAVTLGPRILRADTAAVAALTIWHQALGDWRA
ncbi:MAG: 16S rRNA (uracil(1498)-N(3))-methyltransferase [Pseudomonadota bacterium]